MSGFIGGGSGGSVAVGDVTGLGTGVGTFLATPSSANLASAVTGETGSGAAVFGTAPTLSAPVITGAVQPMEAFTADDTLTVAESGKLCTNVGAGGTVILTLPPATGSGVWFDFGVMATQTLTLEPNDADDQIFFSASVTTAGTGTLSVGTIGRACRIVDVAANKWLATAQVGAWTAS